MDESGAAAEATKPERDRSRIQAVGRATLHHLTSLDFLVPALIGAISLSAALLTWQSLRHSDRAITADRHYVLEREREENARARMEVDIGAYLDSYALASAELDVAGELLVSATSLAADDPRAEALRAEAAELRRVADERMTRGQVNRDGEGRPILDEETRRAELLRYYEWSIPPRPEVWKALGADERESSQRLARLVVWLAAGGLVATIAHVTRRHRPKVALAIAAVVMWSGTLVVAAAGIG